MSNICATCNREHGVDGYMPRHPFRSKSEPAFMPEAKTGDPIEPQHVRGPFDPVLRQALIDKGVITIDDLRNAEAKILVVTGQFHETVRDIFREVNGDDGTPTPASGS